MSRLGDTVTITLQVKTALGVLTDPTTLTAQIRDPLDTITSYVYPTTITRIGTGLYTITLVLAESDTVGTWEVRSRSVGVVNGTGAFGFEVKGIWDA